VSILLRVREGAIPIAPVAPFRYTPLLPHCMRYSLKNGLCGNGARKSECSPEAAGRLKRQSLKQSGIDKGREAS